MSRKAKNEATAICISTVHAKNLGVLTSSINDYVPEGIEVYIGYGEALQSHFRAGKEYIEFRSSAKNYGDAYNLVVKKAFEKHERVIICNDDIVFTPSTFQTLNEDWNMISEEIGEANIGWMACLTDYAIGMQNIRRNPKLKDSEQPEKERAIKNYREDKIIETNMVIPICGMVHRENWVDYLPINYFSDVVQCHEMKKKGKRHFISTAYVHHVGSQTTGDPEAESKIALEHLAEYRPDLLEVIKGMMK